jgi:hypothetical protein
MFASPDVRDTKLVFNPDSRVLGETELGRGNIDMGFGSAGMFGGIVRVWGEVPLLSIKRCT